MRRAEAPGLTVIVGQEIRTHGGRPDRRLPRTRRSRPGCRPPRRSPPCASRAGSSASPTRSTGSAARVGRGEAAALEALAGDGRLDRGLERAADDRRRQRARGRARRAPRRARRRGLRRAHDARGRRRGHDRSTAIPRRPTACAPRSPAPIELVTGRASAYVRLIAPAAKLVQRARGRGRVQPHVADVDERDRRRRRPAPPIEPTRRRRRGGVRPDQLSLAQRLRQPRTIISLVLPIVLLVLFVAEPARLQARGAAGQDPRREPVAAARGVRDLLPRLPAARPALGDPRPPDAASRSGSATRPRSSSCRWLVNCLVPAKLGDVYRAYLLKINSPVSLSRTFGTVFIERILDLFAIVVLGLAAGLRVVPERPARRTSRSCSRSAWSFVLVLAGGLLTMRNFGRRILTRLPLPHRVLEFYDRFEEGVFASIGLRAPAAARGRSPASSGRPRRCACTSSSRRSGCPDVHLGHQRRVLRRAVRVAAHRGAAHAGGHRLRRGRRRRAC